MAKKKKIKKSFSDRIGGVFDSAIGLFSPEIAYKRSVFRMANGEMRAMSGKYTGARANRTNESWVTTGSSADHDLLPDLAKLRERSRDLVRNNPFAASIAHTLDTNVIGSGLKPQSRLNYEKLGISADKADYFQKKLEDIWQKWIKFADAGNRLDFYQMQRLVSRQRFENGDVFMLPLMINDDDRRPYRLAFQVIEADRVDTPYSKLSDKKMRAGVEIGKYGQPVAYHVCDGFPGDYRYGAYMHNMDFRRIPAYNANGRKNVLHIYSMMRPDQSRGVPDLAPVIESFFNLDKYLQAEILSARVSACLSLFIKTQPEAMNSGFGLAGSGAEENSRSQIVDEIEPGMVKYLFPGEDVVTWNPARPGQTFDAFVQVILRMIAAGINMPYELVAKDYSKSNYSNMRASLLQAYKGFRNNQSFIIANLCQPAWEMLIEEAYLSGDLEIPNFYENFHLWTKVQWLADGWEWVDPLKETNACVIALQNNMTTLAEVAAQRGQDAEELIEQRARELKMQKNAEERHGIKFSENKESSAASQNTEDDNKKKEDESDEEDE